MAGRVDWFGNDFIRKMQAQTRRNTNVAAIRLKNLIQAEINQSGVLAYHPTGKSGKVLKRQVKVYNFTHSKPGNPPYKQSGELRRSISREIIVVGGGATVIGRVGSYLKKAKWLELGTRRMKRRPFIVVTLRKNEAVIRAILLGNIAPGSLGAIIPASSRSGVLGRGGIGAGF